MKTAMQEHFEWLEENQLELDIPIAAIDNAEDLIYKEKQQIQQIFNDAFVYGFTKTNISVNEYYEHKFNKKL